MRRYSPPASEKYAIVLPSGDQAGERSTTAGVRVRARLSPFFAGTVKMSPRASNTARAPVGEMSAFWMKGTALAQGGRVAGGSGFTWVTSTDSALVAGL